MRNVILIILDGWGYAAAWGGNAITMANTPHYDYLLRKCPYTVIAASGKFVGLPGHEVGNSEVGHMNIGAGQVVRQDISKINEAIEDGSFYTNPVLVGAIRRAKADGAAVHLMGIVSDGGVHSHIVHLFALLKLCHDLGAPKVYIHAFTDGRDSNPMEGIEFISKLERLIGVLKTGRIATVIGRTYLDRKGDWLKTQVAYNALVGGKGNTAKSALSAISGAYKSGQTDEYVKPIIIGTDGRIQDNDAVIFFHYRSDRTRQLSRAFMEKNFIFFHRHKALNLDFITFIPYGIERELGVAARSPFKAMTIVDTLGKYFEGLGRRQFHIAETEKYAHVTYFLNGNREEPYEGEDRMIVPSPNVHSYDEKPEMSAPEVVLNLVSHIRRKEFGLIVCNIANGDMVGHTGNFHAAVKAVECIDGLLKDVANACLDLELPLIITADHGNIEQMVDPRTGKPYTEHTNNPVPFIVVGTQPGRKENVYLSSGGKLANIAPTLIDLAGLELPKYFAPSLIRKQSSLE